MGTVAPSDWEVEVRRLLIRREHSFAGRGWRFDGERIGNKRT